MRLASRHGRRRSPPRLRLARCPRRLPGGTGGESEQRVAHRGYAFLLTIQRRHEDAIRAAELARELDPLCLVPSLVAAWARYAAGQFEEVMVECRHTLDMGVAFVPAWRLLAAAQLELDQAHEAVHAGRRSPARWQQPAAARLADARVLEGRDGDEDGVKLLDRIGTQPSGYVSRITWRWRRSGWGISSRRSNASTQAYVNRDPMIAHLAIEPRFEPLRDDPRYAELLQLMNELI